jgi:hypothetical protein
MSRDYAIIGARVAVRTGALALVFLFGPPASGTIEPMTGKVLLVAAARIGNPGFVSPARAQPAPLSQAQSDALNAYNNALSEFRSILRQRRAQIDSGAPLPNLPGQALYLARNKMLSA